MRPLSFVSHFWGAVQVVLGIEEAEFVEAGFEAADAGQSPLGHDDLLEQGGFDGADGAQVIFEAA